MALTRFNSGSPIRTRQLNVIQMGAAAIEPGLFPWGTFYRFGVPHRTQGNGVSMITGLVLTFSPRMPSKIEP